MNRLTISQFFLYLFILLRSIKSENINELFDSTIQKLDDSITEFQSFQKSHESIIPHELWKQEKTFLHEAMDVFDNMDGPSSANYIFKTPREKAFIKIRNRRLKYEKLVFQYFFPRILRRKEREKAYNFDTYEAYINLWIHELEELKERYEKDQKNNQCNQVKENEKEKEESISFERQFNLYEEIEKELEKSNIILKSKRMKEINEDSIESNSEEHFHGRLLQKNVKQENQKLINQCSKARTDFILFIMYDYKWIYKCLKKFQDYLTPIHMKQHEEWIELFYSKWKTFLSPKEQPKLEKQYQKLNEYMIEYKQNYEKYNALKTKYIKEKNIHQGDVSELKQLFHLVHRSEIISPREYRSITSRSL